MRNIIFAFVGIMLIGGAIGADVVERTGCDDIKARIDTLIAQDELNDSDAALLTDLRALYRTKCVVRDAGRGRRTAAAMRGLGLGNNTSDVDAAVADVSVVDDACDNPDANGCCPGEILEDIGGGVKYCCKDDACFPPMDVTPVAPEKSEQEIAAEIAANIEKGLCGDGTKPNKYGCCTGEFFKDLGNATFACCKKDSTDCYPPIN